MYLIVVGYLGIKIISGYFPHFQTIEYSIINSPTKPGFTLRSNRHVRVRDGVAFDVS